MVRGGGQLEEWQAMRFNEDEQVTILYQGRKADAEVLLVSADSLSLALRFNCALGNYDGLMLVLWWGDRYVDLIWGEPVEILPRQRAEEVAAAWQDMHHWTY